MNSQGVLELVHTLQQAGIEVWLDGGWGMDALLGQQTREHADLDVVVALSDVETIKHLLSPSGFVEAEARLGPQSGGAHAWCTQLRCPAEALDCGADRSVGSRGTDA